MRVGRVARLAVAAVLAAVSLGCAATAPPATPTPTPTRLAVAGLRGPTGIGLAPLVTGAVGAGAGVTFEVTLYGNADEITPQLVTGTLPLATVPVNLAAVLYAKTDGRVQLAAVNTLGVLYVVAKGAPADQIHSLADLAGRVVWSTGKGTTPEYVMAHLLERAGLAGGVDVQYLSEAAEVASRLVATDSGVAVLPEPYLTAVLAKDATIVPVIDLTQAWAQYHPDSPLVTGALVVNRDWAQANPDLFEVFTEYYEEAIRFTVADPGQAAAGIAQVGILPDAATAEQAIPRCHLVFLTGAEARTAVDGYLRLLYEADPVSVGGTLPGDDFYRAV